MALCGAECGAMPTIAWKSTRRICTFVMRAHLGAPYRRTDTGSCTCNIAMQRAPHSHDEYAAVEPVVDAIIGLDDDIALVRGGFVRAAAAAVPAAGELVSCERGEQ